jgi:NhaA family Na+:H+ antiporter
LGGFDPAQSDRDERALNNRQQVAAHTLEVISERIQTPAQRLEHAITPWATYLVLPLFALANAGVEIKGNILQALTQPVALGLILGLVFGKVIGISFFTWLAVKMRVAELPSRVTWPQLISATCLTGIGFTMSLFISNSAFDNEALLSTAKISILVASLLASTMGATLLLLTTSKRERTTEMDSVQATG